MATTTRFVPHKSTVHRIAAIALYRALITQASAARTLPAVERNEISNIVRNRFRDARHNQSLRQLRVYFDAGYEALDHLDVMAAGIELAGEEEIQRRRTTIESLLETTPDHMKLPETHDWRQKRKRELRDTANSERWTQELLSEGLPVTAHALGRKKLRDQTRKEDERLGQAWLLQRERRAQRRLRQRGSGKSAREKVHMRDLPVAELSEDQNPDPFEPIPPLLTGAQSDLSSPLTSKRSMTHVPSTSTVPGPASQPQHEKSGLDRRPLPKNMLSGRRHIPILYSANMVPVLRFKRPQPVALSIYLRKAVARRQRRTDNRLRLEAEHRLAELEDQWDAGLSLTDREESTAATTHEQSLNDYNDEPTAEGQNGREASYETAPSRWCQPVASSLKQISRQITDEYNRRIDVAAKMQRIVDEEVALKAEERRMAQRRRQQLRQAQQDEKVPNAEGSREEQPQA